MVKIIFFAYRALISPVFQSVFGINCKFEETCSKYAERTIHEEGIVLAIPKILIRICKCI